MKQLWFRKLLYAAMIFLVFFIGVLGSQCRHFGFDQNSGAHDFQRPPFGRCISYESGAFAV